jgi:WD40 repeat protein
VGGDAMKIRNIAAARDVPVVAIGAWEHEVEVWDAASAIRTAAFNTALESGGRRLAVSHDGTRVAAAAYREHGLSVFDVNSGRLVWTRKDLQGIQTLTWSRDGSRLYCGLDVNSLHEIDIATGQTLEKLKNVRTRVDSPFDNAFLLDGKNLKVNTTRGLSFLPRRETFCVLDASFSPDELAISESGGSIRIFSLLSGAEIARHNPPTGVHALNLAYAGGSGAFFALLWPYQNGGSKSLVRLDISDGSVNSVADLGQPAETEFSASLSAMVCSTGELVDVHSGVRRLFCSPTQ